MLLDMAKRDGYDIAAGLRGPDQGKLESCKWAFTALLRHYVGMDCYDLCSIRDTPLGKEHINWIKAEMEYFLDSDVATRYGTIHFIGHIYLAAHALKNRADNAYAREHLRLVAETASIYYDALMNGRRVSLYLASPMLDELYEHEGHWGHVWPDPGTQTEEA